jgi:drug/metabolite transporter (DMT)-like permease
MKAAFPFSPFHSSLLLFILCLVFVLILCFYFKYITDYILRFRNSLISKENSSISSSSPEFLSKLHARLLLITCAAMYGSNFVGTKILQQSLAPSLITTLRFLLGSCFFLKSIYTFRGDSRVIRGAFELGVWTAAGFLIQAITLQYTTANKNAFLCALSVVMIPIIESCVYCSSRCQCCCRSPVTAITVTGTMTTTATVTGKGNHSNLHSVIIPAVFAVSGIAALECGGLDPPALIDLVVLIAPVCFAMGFWRTEQLAAHYPNDTPVITGTLLMTTTFICLLYSLLSGEFPRSANDFKLAYSTIVLDWHVLGALLYAGQVHPPLSASVSSNISPFSGILMTAWSSYAEQCSLKVLSAAEATVIYSLEPLFAAVFSSIFLHEYFGWNSFLGAFCIILACLWNTLLLPSLSYYFPLLAIALPPDNQSPGAHKSIV